MGGWDWLEVEGAAAERFADGLTRQEQLAADARGRQRQAGRIPNIQQCRNSHFAPVDSNFLLVYQNPSVINHQWHTVACQSPIPTYTGAADPQGRGAGVGNDADLHPRLLDLLPALNTSSQIAQNHLHQRFFANPKSKLLIF